jgi:hypothetical protein
VLNHSEQVTTQANLNPAGFWIRLAAVILDVFNYNSITRLLRRSFFCVPKGNVWVNLATGELKHHWLGKRMNKGVKSSFIRTDRMIQKDETQIVCF